MERNDKVAETTGGTGGIGQATAPAFLGEYIKRQADDPDRWLRGTRRLRARTNH